MHIHKNNIYCSQTATPDSMSIHVKGYEINLTRAAIIVLLLFAGKSLQCKITFI